MTTKMNFASFDMEIEIDWYDVEVVAPFSFNEDIIHNKIGTNECNKFGICKRMRFYSGRREGRGRLGR